MWLKVERSEKKMKYPTSKAYHFICETCGGSAYAWACMADLKQTARATKDLFMAIKLKNENYFNCRCILHGVEYNWDMGKDNSNN